jgi:hypothetical protein
MTDESDPDPGERPAAPATRAGLEQDFEWWLFLVARAPPIPLGTRLLERPLPPRRP